MNLEQAGQLCFDQVPLIAKRLPLDYWQNQFDWVNRVRILFDDEARLKNVLDSAMRQFCETRQWPDLPAGPLNFLVCARLECACDTVNILLVRDFQAAHEQDSATLLNWLLIESWNEWRWDAFLKLEVLRSLGGQNTFYSAPPPPPRLN